jgi:hypothetical protein
VPELGRCPDIRGKAAASRSPTSFSLTGPGEAPDWQVIEIQMLGRRAYPLHSIANLFTFDLTIRLRDDILTPRGPVDRRLARCAGHWPMRPWPFAAEIWGRCSPSHSAF